MGFSRQEYWSRLLFPSPGDLPDPGIKPRSSTLWADSLPSEPPGKSKCLLPDNYPIPKGVSFPTKKLKPAPEEWQSPGGRKCWSSQFWSQVLNSAPFHHTSLNRMRKGIFFFVRSHWNVEIVPATHLLQLVHGHWKKKLKGMAPHSSIFSWEIPWTEKPGGLQTMGSQREGRVRVTNTLTFDFERRNCILQCLCFPRSQTYLCGEISQ